MHEPLKWLAGQKMEGILYRWAVALQEYDFKIVYRKGTLNMLCLGGGNLLRYQLQSQERRDST